MKKPEPKSVDEFLHFQKIPTRWIDNDVYQHVNNVIYYSFFDTVVNHYLIDKGLLNIKESTIIGLVVETKCNYFSPIEFPDVVNAGLTVTKIGNSSVNYDVALFNNNESKASAQGHFIHVYVDRSSRKPVPLTKKMRKALEDIAFRR